MKLSVVLLCIAACVLLISTVSAWGGHGHGCVRRAQDATKLELTGGDLSGASEPGAHLCLTTRPWSVCLLRSHCYSLLMLLRLA